MAKTRNEESPAASRKNDPVEAATSPPVVGGLPGAVGSQATQGLAASVSGSEPTFDFLAPPQAPDELGRLGPYRVLKVLGQGGMGVVFQAEDVRLKRVVALKALLPALAHKPEARERFLREARAAAAIEHDHIVAIHQVDEDRGIPYIAMPFLKGLSLEDFLQQKAARGTRLKLAEICKIGREIARGLAAAHARGLIHRDVKPANVWLDQSAGGRVKILDFGLARLIQQGDEKNLTQSGAILGTPAYMSPEQAQGCPVDARTDLFSLGVILYRLCTDELPFSGPDVISTLRALALHEPPSPQSLRADLPPELSDLVMQLLVKEPAKRPASAQDVARAIGAIEKACLGSPSATAKASASAQVRAAVPRGRHDTAALQQSSRPFGSRRLLLLGLVGVAATVAVVVAALVLFRPPRQDPRPQDPFSATAPSEAGPTIIPDPKTPRLKGHTADIRGIRFLPDGKRAVSTGRDGRVILWDVANGKLIRDFSPIRAPWREGNTLLARAMDRGLAVSADGKLLATGSEENRAGIVSIFDLEKETLLWSRPGPTRPKDGREPGIVSLAFTKDGQRLLLAARSDGRYGTGLFNVLAVDTGKTLATHTVGIWSTVVSGLTVLPDEKRVLCSVRNFYSDEKNPAGSKTAVVLWDMERKMEVRRFPQPNKGFAGLALFPDGERVVIAQQGEDAAIQIWPLIGKDPIRQWKAAASTLKLLHGGRWLLTTGADKRTITIWDTATGKALHEMQTDSPVAEVADVSPDGKWLLTGGGTKEDGDFDLHLWRLPE